MPAIHLGSNARVQLDNVHISGFHVGIQGDPGSSIDGNNISFSDVAIPFDMPGSGPSSVRGTRITKPRNETKRGSFSGWTRPSGPALPAFCPNCKSVFPSRTYNFGSSHFYSRDNEEVCPVCRFEHAKLSDGLFDLTSQAVKIVSAPDLTHAMLAAISALADDVSADRIEPEAAIKRFGEISPALGEALSKAWKIGKAAFSFLCMASGVAALVYAHVQTNIANQTLTEQRETNLASEVVTERVLEALDEISFRLEDAGDNESGDTGEQPSAGPAQNEPVAKRSAADRKKKR